MTTASPMPASGAAPLMAQTPDTPPRSHSEARPAQAQPAQAPAAAARPSLRAQAAEYRLLSFFGLMVIALLAAAIAAPNIRINDTNRSIERLEDEMKAGFAAVDARFIEVEDRINARIDRLDAKFGAEFDELEAKFDDRFNELEAKFDSKLNELNDEFNELNNKLTALIAHLGATDEVSNAQQGRLAGAAVPAVGGPRGGDDDQRGLGGGTPALATPGVDGQVAHDDGIVQDGTHLLSSLEVHAR